MNSLTNNRQNKIKSFSMCKFLFKQFDNQKKSIKVCFSNKKYTITTQTRPTQIVNLLKNRVLTDYERLLVYKFNYQSLFV